MNRRQFVTRLALAGLIPWTVWRQFMSDQFPVLADTGGDFVTKDELAQALVNYLALDGGFMRGPIDLGGQRISEGIISTASAAGRLEMGQAGNPTTLFLYTGGDGEAAAGKLSVTGTGTKGLVSLRSPRFLSSTAGATTLTLTSADSSGAPDGSFSLGTDLSVGTLATVDGATPSSGSNVLISALGGTAPFVTISVAASKFLKVDDSGDVTGNHGSYHVASDRALKEDIEPINAALDKVNQLEGVTYRFIDGDGRVMMGLIYQDVEPVVPEVAVKTGEYGAVEYPHLVPLLIEAIKTLTARVEQLEA